VTLCQQVSYFSAYLDAVRDSKSPPNAVEKLRVVCENQCTKSHTVLENVNTFLTVFCALVELEKVSLNLLKPSGNLTYDQV
jgi:hypothetical protein